MSFEVFLHPSTASPPPDAFEASVDVALASVGAVRGPDGEGVTTADGSTFELFLDNQDDIALLTLDTIDDSVVDTVFAVMAGTHSFMLSSGFVCRGPDTGDVLPSVAMSFPQATDIRDREDLQEILHSALHASEEGEPSDEDLWTPTDEELEAAAMAAAPPPEADPIVSKPDRPLLQRISDALFGKSI